jgi:hypothetical protein
MSRPASLDPGHEIGFPEGPAHLRPYLRSPLKPLERALSGNSEGRLLIRGIGCSCDNSARVFSIEINEESGVARATCRLCRKSFTLYDRAVAWGVPRQTEMLPKTFPYKCCCGGHSFQIAVGMEYPSDPMGDDDLIQFTVGAACLACDEVAIAFDDEAD